MAEFRYCAARMPRDNLQATTLYSSAPSSRDAALIENVRLALQAQEIDRAIALARTALDLGTIDALLLNLRACWLESQGRLDEALRDLCHARKLAPHDVPVLNALGLCLVRLDRTDEALEAFGAALAVQSDFAPARFNRAWVSEAAGKLEAARMDYCSLVEQQPAHADAWAGLAFVSVRLAEWQEARYSAGRSLELEPGQATANLALASVEVEEGNYSGAESRLNSLLQDTRISPASAALTRGLLGDALDGQNRIEEAFAAYRDANAQLRALHAARFEGPGVQSAFHYVSRLGDWFEREAESAWSQPAVFERRPSEPLLHAFIVGFPRSGTTLLEQAFGNRTDTVTTGEKDALVNSAHAFMSAPAGLRTLSCAGGNELASYREDYWRRLRAVGIAFQDKVLLDKLPLSSIKLPVIARLFPEAKIILAVRDPRDVVLSCFRRRFRMNASMFEFLTLDGASRYYAAVMRLVEIYRTKLPLNLSVLRHEYLIAGFETELRRVCEFLGCDWQESMLDFVGRARENAVATPSAVQLARGLNTRGAGQWRRYARELRSVMPTLMPWVEKFGYPP